MHYFIQLDDLPHGPLTLGQIRVGILERRYKLTDLVRRETEDQWQPLASIAEIALSGRGTLIPLRNPMAKASLFLGWAGIMVIAGFLTSVTLDSLNFLLPLFLIPILPLSLLAIILGNFALNKIALCASEMEGLRSAKRGRLLGVLTLLLPVCFSLLIPTFAKTAPRGNQSKAINNCKQIIATLKLYSGDSSPKYPTHDLPDARTSNDVFRLLFKVGVADSEAIFGCPGSSDGNPDGNIGKAPDYTEALKAGENHWAMTKGIDDDNDGNIPLVYESPADATWPPKWNPDAAGTTKKGRTWSGGKVIIGFIDGSVVAWPLVSTKGGHVGLRPRADGTPIFPDPPPGQKYEVLDVAP